MRRYDWAGTGIGWFNDRAIGSAKHGIQTALLDVAAHMLSGGSVSPGLAGMVWLALTYELVERLPARPGPRRAA